MSRAAASPLPSASRMFIIRAREEGASNRGPPPCGQRPAPSLSDRGRRAFAVRGAVSCRVSGSPAWSALALLPVPRVLPLATDLPRHVVVVEVVAEGWVPAWPTGLRHSSPCAGTLLRMSMRWLDVSGRLTTTYVVKLPLWVLPSPPALLMYLSILLLRRSTSGTSRHTGCLL